MYLWHKDLVTKAQEWAGDAPFEGNFWQIFVVVCVVSTVLAWITYLLVEQPSLQLSRPRRDRQPTLWSRLLADLRAGSTGASRGGGSDAG